jgi:hypothetical protein
MKRQSARNAIDPVNLAAQISYRAAGNPPVTMPETAISNCFPGLECDFRNVWRHIFEGVILHEADNYVVGIEKGYQQFEGLKGCRLLFVEDDPIVVQVKGPTLPGQPSVPLGTSSLEWSNALAAKLATPGAEFTCYFTSKPSPTQPTIDEDLTPEDFRKRLKELTTPTKLKIRSFFATVTGNADKGILPVIARELLGPGDLTQSLCSPWQNDYRECACYYWASSRPDYVNVEPGPDGLSRGHNWMMKDRTGPPEYLPDDRKDSRLISYEDLFGSWQKLLRFQIGGRDFE